jgi:hypothetical protein
LRLSANCPLSGVGNRELASSVSPGDERQREAHATIRNRVPSFEAAWNQVLC